MKILTPEEAKDFLTKDDLQKLEAGITDGSLRAELVNDWPVLIVRKQPVLLFTILELIGAQ
jgi:hypothetical protein